VEFRKKLSDLLQIVTFNSSIEDEGLRGGYFNETQLWTIGEQTLHQTLSQWVNPVLNEWWYDLLLPGALMPAHGLDNFLTKTVIEEGVIPLEVTDTGEIAGPVTSEKLATQAFDAGNKEFGKMAAIIRERPFPNTLNRDDSLWFHLPTWKLPTWMVNQSTLGRSGEERKNLFELILEGTINASEQHVVTPPAWNEADIKARGLRPYQMTTRFYASGQNKGPGDWLLERSDWQQLLTDWIAPTPYLRSGQIEVGTVLPEVRIGQKLLLDPGADNDEELEQFYVEGTRIDYVAPSQTSGASGKTAFVVTRGFKGTDDQLLSKVLDTTGDLGFYPEKF
jgi:hypothetical protein